MPRLFILLFLLASLVSIRAQSDHFRGSNRNGIYPDTGLLQQWPETGPELITSMEGIGDGYGDVFCLNNATGEFIWRKNIFDIYKSKTSKWGYTESPLFYKNLVILAPGGPGQNVVALDKMTGEQSWSINLDSAVNAYNSPFLINYKGEDFILMNATNELLMIHPESGIIAYRHSIEQRSNNHAISALYSNGKIFFSSGYGQGSALLNPNEATGGMDTIYANPDLDCKLSGMIPFQGTVCGTSDKKKQWIGVDLESGRTLFTTRELKPGSFLLADEKFYIFTETGEVALAIPGKEGFTLISRFSIPVQPARLAFAYPVMYQGVLYLRYREHLWLYDVKNN